MPVTSIYLIRHAETTWNAERRLQGKLDAPLSERGALQVRALVDALRPVRFAALYASPLPRAQETARPVAAAQGLSVRIVDAFREIDQGEWESRLIDEVRQNDGERLQAWWDSPDAVRMPGGEMLAEVQARAVAALGELATRHDGETIAIVAHGGVNKTLLLWVLGAPLASYWRLRQHNACINVVEFDDGTSRVITINETAHLGDDAWLSA
ncbi:MAG: histidine phosphatase family protein [Armatimonadota bacterium]|nr:histidine phosphatase family protein [Armatimonadota bacterium]